VIRNALVDVIRNALIDLISTSLVELRRTALVALIINYIRGLIRKILVDLRSFH
jgi:hypothetical protein